VFAAVVLFGCLTVRDGQQGQDVAAERAHDVHHRYEAAAAAAAALKAAAAATAELVTIPLLIV
jgi:hypothetical protein